MNPLRLNKVTLLLLVLLISAVFLAMIRSYLMVLLLAGIFSAVAQPVYKKFVVWLKGQKNLAAAVTLLLIFLLIFLPLISLLGIVAGQAIKVGHSVSPWIQRQIQQPSELLSIFENLPFYETLVEYNEVILEKAGQLVSGASTFLVNSVSSFTMSTVNVVFLFFIFLYTMFFFLKDGKKLLAKILYYLPLKDEDEQKMLDRFTSVTRATLKGTVIIGILQGGLAGIGFWVVGIDSVIFWSTIMVVLSIIPVIGSSLIWIPAVIILAASGAFIKAIGLAVYCGLLVGSLDNLLRPMLVGKDTKMHEMFILLGTLGGIGMFGIIGFIIGPIIAALFVTIWELYGETFKAYLPSVGPSEIDEVMEPDDEEITENSGEDEENT